MGMIVAVSAYVLFEALSIVMCLHYLYGKKFKLDIKTIIFVGIDVALMELIYFMGIGQIWSLTIYPVIIIYCCAEFGYDLKKLCINNILYMIILSSLQAAIMLIVSFVLKSSKLGVIENTFINILIFLTVVGILSKCNLAKLSNILQNNEVIIILSIIVSFISALYFLLTYKQSKSFDFLFYIILCVSSILVIAAAIDIGKHKIKRMEAEAELKLHKMYEDSFKRLIDDICAKQHEFDNHINTIYSQHFLCKSYEELVLAQKKYCKQLEKENKFNRLLSKGNPIVIGFLYGKFIDIENEGISVSYRINICELEVSMPIYKVIEIIGNLINNAEEAVCSSNIEKKMRVIVQENDEKILIEVANRSEVIDYKQIQQFFLRGYSQKGKYRGYGLYNVKKICDDYGGDIECFNDTIEDQNWIAFRVTVNKPLCDK